MSNTLIDLTKDDLTRQFNLEFLEDALTKAIITEQVETVRYYLDRGVDPDAPTQRNAPLGNSFHPGIIALLLERGATRGLKEAIYAATFTKKTDALLLLLHAARDVLPDGNINPIQPQQRGDEYLNILIELELECRRQRAADNEVWTPAPSP
jgi:hypothetical protein